MLSFRGSIGDIVFHNPKTEIRKELEELEMVDNLMSTHKPRSINKEDTEAIRDSKEEVTTEKELMERLSEVYMLNNDADEPVEADSNTCDRKESTSDSSISSGSTIEKTGGSGLHQVSKSKTEYLMELLDKRESLAAELNIQKEKLRTHDSSILQSQKDIISSEETGMNQTVVNTQKLGSERILRNIKRVEEQKQLEVDSDDEVCDESKNSQENVPMVMPSCITEVRETQSLQSSVMESTTRTGKPVDDSRSSKAKSPINIYIFTLLWQILHEWKTTATIDYLTNGNRKREISHFEEKYEALERTVDDRQIDEDFGVTQKDETEVNFIDDTDINLIFIL